MVVRFQVVAPVAKRRTFTVRLPILLGRGEDAKLRIQHDKVSRRHCELFERGGHVYVRDLGSTNGTFLDDEQVPASAKIRVPPGGVVRVGGLSFAVEYEPVEHNPASAEDGGTRAGEGIDAAGRGAEASHAETTNVASTEEHIDFKVEHAEDERAAAASPGFAAAAAAGGDAEEVVEGEPAEPASHRPDSADPPPVADAPRTGFDFLSAVEAADGAAEPPQWPSPADDTVDDGPDDDQLNAFFKGLK